MRKLKIKKQKVEKNNSENPTIIVGSFDEEQPEGFRSNLYTPRVCDFE